MRPVRVASIFLASMLVLAGCSASSGTPSPTDRPDPVYEMRTGPVSLTDGMPIEALDLLARSAADSCASCARDLRKRAFRLLDERLGPGVIVVSDSTSWFLRGSAANELLLASEVDGDVPLTFRFHTVEDHLVGIAAPDLTDESLADPCRSAPEGTKFQGALEIVGFAYGDGATFLYHASSRRVEVHCKILGLVP